MRAWTAGRKTATRAGLALAFGLVMTVSGCGRDGPPVAEDEGADPAAQTSRRAGLRQSDPGRHQAKGPSELRRA